MFMITIEVRFLSHALARGRYRSVQMAVKERTSVNDLLNELVKTWGVLSIGAIDEALVLVNGRRVDWTEELKHKDILVVFSAIGGG